MTTIMTGDDHVDDHVDATISECLSLTRPRSFFLFAAAGSGKTRSLVNAANYIRSHYADQMRLVGKRVGIITYTNAGVDEIKGRLHFDRLFSVSTIHSFAWELIAGFDGNIRQWVEASLREDIAELRAQEAKGRQGKASDERRRKIGQKEERLASLAQIKRFVYSPTGDNVSRDSLNHAEVIKITSAFLTDKPLLQSVLVNRFPFLLIDECQDTNAALVDALFDVQTAHRGQFSLGLFGDMMQRIYADGKVDLGNNLPDDWLQPAKVMNHRSPKRVIGLINKIRAGVDDRVQRARSDASDGHVRLFVSRTDCPDKDAAEARARNRMAEITNDPAWKDVRTVKTLTLEHHMAARRMGFADMFMALNTVGAFQTGLRDGSLAAVRMFSAQALPLVRALGKQDKFGVASVLRSYSPILESDYLKATGAGDPLTRAREATVALAELMAPDKNATFGEVLNLVHRTRLFNVPDILLPFCGDTDERITNEDALADDGTDRASTAISDFLKTPFRQVEPYSEYVGGNAPFDTHQGVKGREFPRVLAVIDDTDARGFMFSYDTLFGIKAASGTDRRDTSLDRTRRLFYVICSRSRQSLAIVAYSANPSAVRAHAVGMSWFADDEVEDLV